MLAHWLIDYAASESLALIQKELPLKWIEQALGVTNKACFR